MKSYSLYFAMGMAICSASAWGNRVLSVTSNEEQVTLTNEATGRRFKLNESVCLVKNGKELACGFIGRLSESSLVVKIESRSYKVAPGYDVVLQRETRHPSSMASSEMAVARDNPKLDIALGPVAGWNYLFPLVPAVQFAVTRTFSLGVDFRYAKSTNLGVSSEAMGLMVNLNYFHTHYAFRGLIFNAGVGLYNINLSYNDGTTTTTEKISPLAFQATVGWRGKPHWGLGIDIGLAGGLQYVTKAPAGVFINEFSGVLPLISLYLGYSL